MPKHNSLEKQLSLDAQELNQVRHTVRLWWDSSTSSCNYQLTRTHCYTGYERQCGILPAWFSSIQGFSRAANQTRLMMQQKVLTAAEVTELDGMFRQATMGDGSAWALLRKPPSPYFYYSVTFLVVVLTGSLVPLQGTPNLWWILG